MNIAIVRAFVSLREIAKNIKALAEQIVEIRHKVIDHDTQLKLIYDAIENLLSDKAELRDWKNRERIGFKK